MILGDRLQAIFGLDAARPLMDWDVHVAPNFTPKVVPHEPHRWQGHNPVLGQWLLDIRSSLVDGGTFDFSTHRVTGLSWRRCDVGTAVRVVNTAAYGLSNEAGSVVLLDKVAAQVAGHASRMGGTYAVMEEISGRFMAKQLNTLPTENDVSLALWLTRLAKSCFVGLADLDKTVQGRLAKGRTTSDLRPDRIPSVKGALDALVVNPTYVQLQASADAIRDAPGLSLYRPEAWDDTLRAIAMSSEDGMSPQDALAVVRDRLRRGGRGPPCQAVLGHPGAPGSPVRA